VIPEIMGRAGEIQPGERPILRPEKCPACVSKLTERGAHLFCMNRTSCRPQAVARIAHFASREAMDIEGLSEKTAGQLYDQAAVREIADLYRLTPMDFLMLEGFKEKKAANLAESLEKSKDCELDAFLFALGIPNVGRKTARDLAQAFGTLEKAENATMEQLTAIPDIGDIVAGSITEYFSFPENLQMIRRMLEAGVKPREAAHGGEGVFSGMSIVVTGTLPTLSRKQAEDLIRSCGGNAAGSVSKKTAFVVVGEDAGSKLTKAQALGIETIDEAELLRRTAR
jgi:DNA ligase (NAD+)